MRRIFLALVAAMLPIAAGAQQIPAQERQMLPSDVRRDVVDRWNGVNALRSTQTTEIAAGREIVGNVAVQHGPLLLAGHVTGDVLALNSDVVLASTARIDGELLVVGGDVGGRSIARVDGATRIYRQPLRYRADGEQIVALDDQQSENDNWWRRLERRREENWNEALRVVQTGPYNRVEGLPVSLGPALSRRTPWGSVRLDAAAIVRTGSSFRSDKGDFGHNIRGEVRIGRHRAVGVGTQIMSVVDPVENWQMSDIEVALASFLARRDYRDYYERHGANAFVTLYGARNVSLSASYGQERWSSRDVANPFTVFNDDREWRTNPVVDEGLFHLGKLALNFDTRSDPDEPSAGWFLSSDVEHGRGRMTSIAPTSELRGSQLGRTDYTRGFFDFRRYNRLGPDAQLNMRLVVGGWLNGDPLPLERRLSVDGPAALPGFDFRSPHGGIDVGTCNSGLGALGRPAECDRIALAQIEYRGDLRLDFMGGLDGFPRRYHSAHGDVQWVFFADAGRGWKVGPEDGGLGYGRGSLPALSTFRTDLGLGLDFAGIGVYAARAVSGSEPLNFFVRLRHRF
jgi:hypothetical protein